ncbi:MAG: peptidyl-prolyl cis-trans isomerase C [Rhodobacteraceae bacterium HLUCCA12]|nr:MAG: peptidyl-prolyl cis-trans isomerase C [Rhodobacteraceae bacterium HLUCCA12]
MEPLLPDVTVNGTRISAERIAAEAQNHPAPKGKPGQAWKSAARALAMRELLLQAARERGLMPEPVEIAPGQVETPDEALVRQLLDAAVTPRPVEEGKLRAHYDADPGRYRAPCLYEAAHILIPVDPAAPDQAFETAQALCAELARDPARFAALARQHSACSSRENGGLLGQVASGDTVPEFEAALSAMRVGAVTEDPVRTRYGFHVIRLDARAEGAVLPFEAVLPRLREAAEKAAWLQAARDFGVALAAEASVTGVRLAVV